MVNTTIVAVCGGSGSGKTTIVNYLIEKIGENNASVLHMDHYYRDLSHLSPSERNEVNFDSPQALDMSALADDLMTLKKGRAISRPTYCFASHTRLPDKVDFHPKRFIVLDGILSNYDPAIRQLVDRAIFVDVAADLRFIRRLQRDLTERGRSVQSVVDQYLDTVRQMYDTYVLPQKHKAQHIVDWTDYDYEAVDRLIAALMSQS